MDRDWGDLSINYDRDVVVEQDFMWERRRAQKAEENDLLFQFEQGAVCYDHWPPQGRNNKRHNPEEGCYTGEGSKHRKVVLIEKNRKAVLIERAAELLANEDLYGPTNGSTNGKENPYDWRKDPQYAEHLVSDDDRKGARPFKGLKLTLGLN